MDDFLQNDMRFLFLDFELCGRSEQLFFNGERVKVEPQLFNFLTLLLANRGEVISRQQIQDFVWAGRPVTDEAIRAAIKKLREILGDDARAPKFIKTIPKQGYKWLAPVEIIPTDSDVDSSLNNRARTLAMASFLVGVLAIIVWTQFESEILGGISDNAVTPDMNIELLTSLSGSEVFADYHHGDNKIAFLHRDSRYNTQQLYLKHLDTNKIQRLSWDNANYSNSYWSKNGQKLAFNRLVDNRITLHIASFTVQGDLREVKQLAAPEVLGKFVIGWLHDDSAILLAEKATAGEQHSIHQYTFKDDSITSMSSPNVIGRGDYMAAQSHDGHKLAILREVGKQQTSLLVIESETGRMLANKSLPFYANSLAWQIDNEAVLLSSFFGESSRYVLKTDFFDETPSLPSNSLDIYASCGVSCYILRRHNGNFLDIQETPLNLSAHDRQPPQESSLFQLGRMLKLEGAQDFPRYLGSGEELMFVSLIDQSMVFQRLDRNHNIQILGKLQRTFQLSSISVSHNAQRIAGTADGRLFTLSAARNDGTVSEIEFLTTALERLENPVWHSDNIQVYVTQYTDNKPTIVLYNTQTQERQSVIQGMLGFQPLTDDPITAIGIDTDLMAWQLVQTAVGWKKMKVLAEVASPNPQRWQVINNRLYFSRGGEWESYLCMVPLSIDDAKHSETCRSLGKNRFRLNFDVHPIQDKVLLVESLSAQSDIIKLSW